jgi:hypothetical protein
MWQVEGGCSEADHGLLVEFVDRSASSVRLVIVIGAPGEGSDVFGMQAQHLDFLVHAVAEGTVVRKP